MQQFLDKIPFSILIAGTLTLGLAPFFPEPHVWEKLKMLMAGSLSRPIDIFDLFMHGTIPALLIIKSISLLFGKSNPVKKS